MWQSLKEDYSTGDTGDAKLGIWPKRMRRRQNTYFLAVWILKIQVIIQRNIRNNNLNALRKLLR